MTDLLNLLYVRVRVYTLNNCRWLTKGLLSSDDFAHNFVEIRLVILTDVTGLTAIPALLPGIFLPAFGAIIDPIMGILGIAHILPACFLMAIIALLELLGLESGAWKGQRYQTCPHETNPFRSLRRCPPNDDCLTTLYRAKGWTKGAAILAIRSITSFNLNQSHNRTLSRDARIAINYAQLGG